MMPEFVDTNILLYAYDVHAVDRHARARELVGRLGRERRGALSVQVLQEFYVNATRRIVVPLNPEQALDRLRVLSRWRAHSPLPHDVLAAVAISSEHQLSFWDAMVVRSASELGCRRLWTEDLNTGQTIAGVTITNPFA